MTVLDLARAQREQQTALIELLTLDLVALWRRVFGDRPATQDDVADVVKLAAPLVRQYGLASGELARRFYERQRAEAGIRDRFEVPFVEPSPVGQIEQITSWAINPARGRRPGPPPRPGAPARPGRPAPPPAAPRPPDERRDRRAPPDRRPVSDQRRPRPAPPRDPETGLIDLDELADRQRDDLTAGLARAARQPGRLTLEQAALQDPRAVAYARITGPTPCAFCVLMASRGFVYISEGSAQRRGRNQTQEKYHDLCQCDLVATWRSKRGELPEESQQWDDLYRASGAHFRGKDALAALDRALTAQRAGRHVEQAVFDGPADDPDRYRRKAIGGRRRPQKDPAVPGSLPADDARRELARSG